MKRLGILLIAIVMAFAAIGASGADAHTYHYYTYCSGGTLWQYRVTMNANHQPMFVYGPWALNACY